MSDDERDVPRDPDEEEEDELEIGGALEVEEGAEESLDALIDEELDEDEEEDEADGFGKEAFGADKDEE